MLHPEGLSQYPPQIRGSSMQHFFVYLLLIFEAGEIFGKVESFETVKLREKRNLVYPPPGVGNAPTKVQLILGLGLPMEGGLIVGYVLKHNYNLPYNATMLTNPYLRYQRSAYEADYLESKVRVESKKSTTRWETYKMLESAFNIFESGKSCLLRAICEAAGVPFTENHGLLGELLQVFLAPSTTVEEFSENGDQEYFAAESLGRRFVDECRKFASDCEISPLEYFTECVPSYGNDPYHQNWEFARICFPHQQFMAHLTAASWDIKVL